MSHREFARLPRTIKNDRVGRLLIIPGISVFPPLYESTAFISMRVQVMAATSFGATSPRTCFETAASGRGRAGAGAGTGGRAAPVTRENGRCGGGAVPTAELPKGLPPSRCIAASLQGHSDAVHLSRKYPQPASTQRLNESNGMGRKVKARTDLVSGNRELRRRNNRSPSGLGEGRGCK